MAQNLYIITGASRGLGLAMAERLLADHHFVIGISRSANESLASRALELGGTLDQWQLDLEHGAQAGALLEQRLVILNADSFASVTLINNAGVIPSITPLSDADSTDLARALRIGLEAPMLLTAAFLRATQSWSIPKKVLNISSGLGRRAMASQAPYCAAKAGMDHFTRCLALEEALKPNGAKVCSLAPGVIDTDMQVQLRGAPASSFPDHSSFVSLKVNGQLTSPEDAAALVLAFLARVDFGSKPVADIRD